MATKPKSTHASLVSRCNSLITGVTALPDASFLLGGGAVAKAAVVLPLQAYVDAEKEVTTADAAYRAALAKAHAAQPGARAMMTELVPYLRARLGKANPALEAQFGVTPLTPRPTPVASKAAGAVKGKATRAAKKAAVASVGKAPAAAPAAPVGSAPAAAPAPKPTA